MMTNPTTICPEVIFSPPPDDFGGHLSKNNRSTSKRKFSFTASLHSSSLLSETNAIGRTTRRLSNVSDRVTDRVRKLSTAIGWNQAPSKDILLSQSHSLITLYIRYRLKRSGILNHQRKKIGLQKMRSTLGSGAEVREVFLVLREACGVLESMHQKIYTNISRQVASVPGGQFENSEECAMQLSAVGRLLFKNDITWGKIVSLFCVTAGLAIDLVRQNNEDSIPRLIEGFQAVIEDELLLWLTENQGWISLHNKLQDKRTHTQAEYAAILVLLSIIMIFFVINNYFLKF